MKLWTADISALTIVLAENESDVLHIVKDSIEDIIFHDGTDIYINETISVPKEWENCLPRTFFKYKNDTRTVLDWFRELESAKTLQEELDEKQAVFDF